MYLLKEIEIFLQKTLEFKISQVILYAKCAFLDRKLKIQTCSTPGKLEYIYLNMLDSES